MSSFLSESVLFLPGSLSFSFFLTSPLERILLTNSNTQTHTRGSRFSFIPGFSQSSCLPVFGRFPFAVPFDLTAQHLECWTSEDEATLFSLGFLLCLILCRIHCLMHGGRLGFHGKDVDHGPLSGRPKVA